MDCAFVFKPDGRSFTLPTLRIVFGRRQFLGCPAGLGEPRIFLLKFREAPVDGNGLRQGAPDGSVVESQKKEPALLIQRVTKPERAGLQFRPLRAARIRRHAEYEHAGTLQSFLDLRWDAVAGLDLPFLEPHPQPIRPQPLRDVADNVFVLGAVAEEHIEGELLAHVRQSVPPGFNRSDRQTAYSILNGSGGKARRAVRRFPRNSTTAPRGGRARRTRSHPDSCPAPRKGMPLALRDSAELWRRRTTEDL